MSTPIVAIGALGGTIASTPASIPASTPTGGAGVAPTLTAADLVAAVPGLEAIADIRAETRARLPGPSLDEATVLGALAWARVAVDDGAAGVVLTQGTDTIEETSYLLDLFWDRPEPLVVTGAMRAAQAAGADGPANLQAAVRCAAAPGSRDRGVLVAFDDEIHQARWVAKTDSMATGAFTSSAFGPIGRCVEGEVAYASPASRPGALPWPGDLARTPRVALLTTWLGDDGTTLEVVRASAPDGIVVAGFGAGHVSAAMAEVVAGAADQVPVVLASRTGSGPTARAVYDYPGSEIDLAAKGAIGAGWLAPLKARTLLWALALSGIPEIAAVAAEFELRGRL